MDFRFGYITSHGSSLTLECLDPSAFPDAFSFSYWAQAIAYGGTVYVIDGSDYYDNYKVYSYTPGPGAEWDTLPGVSVSYSYRPLFPAPVVTTDALFCVTRG